MKQERENREENKKSYRVKGNTVEREREKRTHRRKFSWNEKI